MPDVCSCGAHLPPDAVFCHKCGRPQKDIVQPEPESPPITVAPPALPAPPPPGAELALNFHNPVAVRIALLVAAGATLLSFLPFLNWIAAGFFAVFLYRRKTGAFLNVNAGVRLGWITGLVTFGLFTVVFLAQQVPAARSGKLIALLREQMKNLPANDPTVQQMMSFFQSAPGMVAVLALALCTFFLFITGLSMAGGALGAKLVGRNPG